MKKHTPGPWKLETAKTSCGICHKIGPFPFRPDRISHACVYVDAASHDGSSPVDQELLANARLIAAAPELLAALEAMMENKTCNPSSMTPAERAALWVSHGKARAAIAKAKGERT